MAVEIKVPDMGESVIEATIARWMKNEGDPVAAGEPLVELETDKVNVEVGAQQAGVLQQIQKQAGDTVAVGDVLAFVAAAGEAMPVTGKAAAGQVVVDTQAGPGPDTGEAEAREARVNDSAAAKAPADRTVSDQTGVTPYEGGQAETQTSTAPQSQPVPAKDAPPPASSGPVTVTPVAQRMAQEQGIDLSQIQPSSGGRITKDDVQAYLEKNKSGAPAQALSPDRAAPAPAAPQPAAPRPETLQPSAPASTAAPRPQPAAPAAQDGREIRERMTRRRQTIARRLVEAQQTAAMLTTFNEVDMTAVMELRKRRRDSFKERFGVDLGFMPFFIKAVIGALKAFPYLNAEIQGDEIVRKKYYDIGIAIGADEGLVVPVVRDADRLSFADIEKAIRGYVTKSKEGTLSLDDLRGGTFTITNGGVYGSLLSTPILNPPQVGILGMHAIKERPVVVDGQIVARPMMYLALSYDHRIVDGREAVQFLVRVKELLEDPETLLFS